MMLTEQTALLTSPMLQDAPPVSPVLLWIIAIALIILFIWLLLRERRAREETAARNAEAMRAATPEPISAPDPATRLGGIEAPAGEIPVEAEIPTEPLVPTVPVAPVESVVPTGPAVPTVPAIDDLEIIEGIGPKIASILKAAGVTSFAQLAAMEPAKITDILQAANLRLADPGSWPEQARLAASGDMVGLKALQDRLTAGRQV